MADAQSQYARLRILPAEAGQGVRVLKLALDDPRARLAMLREVETTQAMARLGLPTVRILELHRCAAGYVNGFVMAHGGSPVARVLGHTWKRPRMSDLLGLAWGVLQTQLKIEAAGYTIFDNHAGNYLLPVSQPPCGHFCLDRVLHIDAAFDISLDDGRPIYMQISDAEFPQMAAAAAADRQDFLKLNGYGMLETWWDKDRRDLFQAFVEWRGATRLTSCLAQPKQGRAYRAVALYKMFFKYPTSFYQAALRARPHPTRTGFLSLCAGLKRDTCTAEMIVAQLEELWQRSGG